MGSINNRGIVSSAIHFMFCSKPARQIRANITIEIKIENLKLIQRQLVPPDVLIVS